MPPQRTQQRDLLSEEVCPQAVSLLSKLWRARTVMRG